MVWFQCEDCGENLKKPKLPGHFRMCSAFKLSCIDCGQVFSQQAVQGHNQCISEAVAALEDQQKDIEGNTDDEGKESGTDMNAADLISKSDNRYENPDINVIPMDEDQTGLSAKWAKVVAPEEQQKDTEGNIDDEGKETGINMNAADPISKSDSRYENPDINDIPMDEDQQANWDASNFKEKLTHDIEA